MEHLPSRKEAEAMESFDNRCVKSPDCVLGFGVEGKQCFNPMSWLRVHFRG